MNYHGEQMAGLHAREAVLSGTAFGDPAQFRHVEHVEALGSYQPKVRVLIV
jgi:hypothetical protein